VGLVLASVTVFVAGKPVPSSEVLCGTGTYGSDRFAGSSDIDHPSGSSFMGSVQPDGTTCTPSDSSGSDFTWTIGHSNVNLSTERGTEHGELLLASSSHEAGFDAHITDFDYTTTMGAGDPPSCGSRTVYYTSGHAYDPCQTSSGPGNFNTHGGAATGDHFRGNYGSVVYQQDDGSGMCDVGSGTYCIEVVLKGQTN
jgi:hypothetical protein